MFSSLILNGISALVGAAAELFELSVRASISTLYVFNVFVDGVLFKFEL